jgi:hypothetical protein
MKFIFIAGLGMMMLSCSTPKSGVKNNEKTGEAVAAKFDCPCLMAHIFPYVKTSGERRIAVHVFNLAEQPLESRVELTSEKRSEQKTATIAAADRALITFPILDVAPLERYTIRVEGWSGSAPVDTVGDVIRLSQFEIDNLMYLNLE